MLQLFRSILNLLSTVTHLLFSTITTILNLIVHLPDFLNLISASFVVLPQYALGLVTLTLSLISIYFVIRIFRG